MAVCLSGGWYVFTAWTSRLIYTAVISSAWLSFCSQSFQISDVLQKEFGAYNFEELEDYLYNVEISSEPIVSMAENHEKENSEKEPHVKIADDAQNVAMVLVSNRGQRYSCSIPHFHIVDSPSVNNGTKLHNVSEILKAMEDRPCLIVTIGWWTYEYCHGKFMRQYHLEAGQPIGKTLYMGFYANETIWDEKSVTQVENMIKSMKNSLDYNSYPVAYHTVFYNNGTICDITKQPRKTLVKIMCTISGEDRISDIQERDTCSYVVYLYTSLLCKIPLFRKVHHGKEKTITCSPLVSEDSYKNFLRKRKEMDEMRMESDLNRDDVDKLVEEEMEGREMSMSPSRVEDDTTSTYEPKLTESLLEKFFNLEKQTEHKDDRTTLLPDKTVNPEFSEEERDEKIGALREKYDSPDADQLQELSENKMVIEEDLDQEEQELMDKLELDEESMAELGEEITAELKKTLSKLGIPNEGTEVKLKLVDLSDLESDDSSEDSTEHSMKEEQETDSMRSKKIDMKVVKLSLSSRNFRDLFRLKNSLQDEARTKESMERARISNLEASYKSLWDDYYDDDDDDQQTKKREKT